MSVCSAKTRLGERCTKPAKSGSKMCSIHSKVRRLNNQKGGSKFDDYVLPEKTHIYVGSEQKRMTENDVLSFDFTNKIVGMVSGCFCPPHKGHFAMIFEACRQNKLDILFLKTVNNSRPRHGVPLEVSLKVLSIYAKYIYDELGTHVFVSSDGIPWSIPNTVNKILNIEVMELKGEPTELNRTQAKEQESANFLTGTSRTYLRNFDKVNNTKVFRRVMFRNSENGLSATIFIREMKSMLTETAKFLPDQMPETEKYQLIADIIYDYGTLLQ